MNITFIRQGKATLVLAQKNEMFAEVVNKYCIKCNIIKEDNCKFFFNGKEIPGDSRKSLEELGMPEMCRIDVVFVHIEIGAFSF